MAFKLEYSNGEQTEIVQADEYTHAGEHGELTTFTRVHTDGLATTTENVLTVRSENVARIEPV